MLVFVSSHYISFNHEITPQTVRISEPRGAAQEKITGLGVCIIPEGNCIFEKVHLSSTVKPSVFGAGVGNDGNQRGHNSHFQRTIALEFIYCFLPFKLFTGYWCS